MNAMLNFIGWLRHSEVASAVLEGCLRNASRPRRFALSFPAACSVVTLLVVFSTSAAPEVAAQRPEQQTSRAELPGDLKGAQGLNTRMTRIENVRDLQNMEGLDPRKPIQDLVIDYLRRNGVSLKEPCYVKFNAATGALLVHASSEELDKADSLLAPFRNPVLRIDDAHHLSCRENFTPEWYHISPSSSLVLNSTGYVFKGTRLPAQGFPVSQITLMRQSPAPHLRYQVPWSPDQTQYQLSAATLHPANDSPAFEGFKSGERWFVLIRGPMGDDGPMVVRWSGLIEVR